MRVTALGLRVQCYTKWEKLLSRKLKSRNFQSRVARTAKGVLR
jgi:hypothetical protein